MAPTKPVKHFASCTHYHQHHAIHKKGLKTMAKYNGYTSWNSWNVSLWINNDYDMYTTARDTVQRLGYVRGLKELVRLWEGKRTPDGARFNRTGIKQAIEEIV